MFVIGIQQLLTIRIEEVKVHDEEITHELLAILTA